MNVTRPVKPIRGNSAIYAYTNERAVPPGPGLLAATLTTGISLDEKLGLVRPQTEIQFQVRALRSEMAELRGIVADLRRGRAVGSTPRPERTGRAAAAPSAQPPPTNSSAGRSRQP